MNTIGKNISILFRQLNLFLNRELADTDLTATELMYLGSLFAGDGVTQDELAREHCIDKAATARTIQGMEKKGYVVRKTDPSDKRAKRVYLTEKAQLYRAKIEEVRKKWRAIIDTGMSEAEFAIFERQIRAITERVKAAIKSEQLGDTPRDYHGLRRDKRHDDERCDEIETYRAQIS